MKFLPKGCHSYFKKRSHETHLVTPVTERPLKRSSQHVLSSGTDLEYHGSENHQRLLSYDSSAECIYPSPDTTLEDVDMVGAKDEEVFQNVGYDCDCDSTETILGSFTVSLSSHMEDISSLTTPVSRSTGLYPLLRSPLEEHPSIFEIPEILSNIISQYVNLISEDTQGTKTKFASSLSGGRPQSYKHALMLYGDKEVTQDVWQEILGKANLTSNIGRSRSRDINGQLLNCLLVNRLWYILTIPYVLRDLYFRDSFKFKQFLSSSREIFGERSILKQWIPPGKYLTNSLTLYKLYSLTTDELEHYATSAIPLENLRALDFHICPNVTPPSSWFPSFQNLEKLALPGNQKISDLFLLEATLYLTKLKYLNLRACENVTDIGVIAVASRCHKLKCIYLGRQRNGRAISDVSLVALGKYTNVETVGLEGSSITDSGLWEFAKTNGENVRRLSLNNCSNLTNAAVSHLFGYNYFPNISVLEIRNLERVTSVRGLVRFMAWRRHLNKPFLMESCERIAELINIEEQRVERKKALIGLREMTAWVNAADDDDEGEEATSRCFVNSRPDVT